MYGQHKSCDYSMQLVNIVEELNSIELRQNVTYCHLVSNGIHFELFT